MTSSSIPIANPSLALVFFSTGAYYLGSLKPASLPKTSTTPLADLDPPRHNVSPSNLQAAWTDFVEILGKENVSTSPGDVEMHSGSDWSSYTRKDDEKPFLILYPSTTEEVSRIMKICPPASDPSHPVLWWHKLGGPLCIHAWRCVH